MADGIFETTTANRVFKSEVRLEHEKLGEDDGKRHWHEQNIKDWNMPVISKFYGIVIRILRAHGLEPQFHAIYGNSELVVSIWPLAVVQGDAPRRVREMVLEWAIQHQQELLG